MELQTGKSFFSDGTSGNAEIRGYVQYLHSSNASMFGVNASEALRITSTGGVHFNNAELIERVNIVAKIQVPSNINLDNGMLHHVHNSRDNHCNTKYHIKQLASIQTMAVGRCTLPVTVVATRGGCMDMSA